MKKEVITYLFSVFLFTSTIGCSNDSHENGGIEIEGESTVVSIKLSDASNTITRAAGNETEAATGDETIIEGKVTILVYDKDDNLELKHTIDNLPNDKKAQFTVKSGRKYFYVVANQVVNETGTTGVIAQKNKMSFERQEMNVSLSDPAEVLSITSGRGNYVIGTLWGQPVDIEAGGTETNPKKITLEIGRAAAKVKLHSVEKGTNSNMDGEFTLPNYRLGSIPQKYYHVGQYAGLIAPPNSNHGKVSSAVHQEPWYQNNPGSGTQNSLFTNYKQWVEVTKLPASTGDPLTEFFYAVENTTALDQQSNQYYGNTTYIQLETVYVPTDEELLDVNDLSSTVTRKGATFWVVTIDKLNYLVGNYDDATAETITQITEVKEYKDGKNYHKFPVRDKSESDPEKMHTVLRNHYYEITVNSIKDLGEPTDKVDPWEPITTETVIEAEIKVIPWSKITQGEDL